MGINAKNDGAEKHPKLPIVYHDKYNVSFFGFEKLHPFDTSKWRNIYTYLKEASFITDEAIYEPSEATAEDLLKVHTKEYLNSLKWSYKVASVAELYPLAFVPNFIIQRLYLQAMRYHVNGSVLAAELAVTRGWGINLGGGFHHCRRDKGEGFCPYADISLIVHTLFEKHASLVKKVMIVDLDAHQGNGHERDFCRDRRVFIMDVYNGQIYPDDVVAKDSITKCMELKNFTKDDEYLPIVKRLLEESLSEFRPDFIIYNAGTDVLEGDRLGQLSITAEGIIERDRIVFMKAQEQHVPVVMLTSGGYLKRTARIIADSILNLAEKQLIGY